MSRIPRGPGQGGPSGNPYKTVTATSSKSTSMPGGRPAGESRTVITQVTSCGKNAQKLRGPDQNTGAIPKIPGMAPRIPCNDLSTPRPERTPREQRPERAMPTQTAPTAQPSMVPRGTGPTPCAALSMQRTAMGPPRGPPMGPPRGPPPRAGPSGIARGMTGLPQPRVPTGLQVPQSYGPPRQAGQTSQSRIGRPPQQSASSQSQGAGSSCKGPCSRPSSTSSATQRSQTGRSQIQPSGLRPPASRPPGLPRPAARPAQTQSRTAPEKRPCPDSCTGEKVTGTKVEGEVQKKMLERSAFMPPGKKVFAKGRLQVPTCVQIIDTPAGPEKILQQAMLERRIERDEEGERVVKNLALTDYDPKTGKATRLEMGMQQLDPNYGIDEGKEVIGITSTVSVTQSYTTVKQESTKATTKHTTGAMSLAPCQVAKLVQEEKEDVENTLRMVPPDLVLQPGKYEIKQRLQKLRLTSESMALLEESIIHPEPTADEAQAEPTPEAMASIMHTVEKGVPPQSAPDQVFNTLFSEAVTDQFIKLSSVTAGPLQDVVIPTEISADVHKEVLCDNMDKLAERMQNIPNADEIPYVDIFTTVMDDEKKSPSKGKNKQKSFQPISDERSLWVNANLEPLVNIVGAEPVEVLDPADVDELEGAGSLEQEMANGIEYYLDADPLQYLSRVQLRGSKHPSYFPGYMLVLPDTPGLIQIARSPDEVFAAAWKSVQPKYFEEESIQSLIF